MAKDLDDLTYVPNRVEAPRSSEPPVFAKGGFQGDPHDPDDELTYIPNHDQAPASQELPKFVRPLPELDESLLYVPNQGEVPQVQQAPAFVTGGFQGDVSMVDDGLTYTPNVAEDALYTAPKRPVATPTVKESKRQDHS